MQRYRSLTEQSGFSAALVFVLLAASDCAMDDRGRGQFVAEGSGGTLAAPTGGSPPPILSPTADASVAVGTGVGVTFRNA